MSKLSSLLHTDSLRSKDTTSFKLHALWLQNANLMAHAASLGRETPLVISVVFPHKPEPKPET